MAKLSRLKPGDVLWDVHSYRTNGGSRRGVWQVVVKEVNQEEGWALCSWNGNPACKYTQRKLDRLRRTRPKEVKDV